MMMSSAGIPLRVIQEISRHNDPVTKAAPLRKFPLSRSVVLGLRESFEISTKLEVNLH